VGGSRDAALSFPFPFFFFFLPFPGEDQMVQVVKRERQRIGYRRGTLPARILTVDYFTPPFSHSFFPPPIWDEDIRVRECSFSDRYKEIFSLKVSRSNKPSHFVFKRREGYGREYDEQ